MAGDRLQELRRALYSGAGAAMVSAVQQVGPETCLQLAGDVLLLAVRHGAAGADELAQQMITMLRDREWDGDSELADALQEATEREHGSLTELAVDLEEVADLLEGDRTVPAVGST